MRAFWLLGLLILCGGGVACDNGRTVSDRAAQNTEDTGPFEIVRERAGGDGLLELRVRAERLESADRIARKLVELRKSKSQRIAKVEFIGMQDPVDGPARRVVERP